MVSCGAVERARAASAAALLVLVAREVRAEKTNRILGQGGILFGEIFAFPTRQLAIFEPQRHGLDLGFAAAAPTLRS